MEREASRMKKVIDNKLYDTDTAEALDKWQHTFSEHSLYKTKKGAYFVVTTSTLSEEESKVLPLPEDELFDWLVENGGDAQAARLFPDRIEEA